MPKRRMNESKPESNRKSKKTKPNDKVESAYTSAQKAAISEFSSVTQADKSTAAKLLKQHGWSVSAAANSFFNNPSNSSNSSNIRASLNSTFDRFRDDPKQSPDEINVEGTSELLKELDLDIADVSAFVFSELVQSPSLGVITREGFVDGWAEVGEDSLPKMRNIVLQRRSQLSSDKDLLKNVYNHAFVLALADTRQKAVAMEVAVEFWRTFFTAPALEWSTEKTPWREWWIEYYEEKVKRAVNKDLWKQTLSFARETLKDDSLAFWTEESSWPSVIDEFVAWVKTEKRPAGGEAMDTE